MKLLLFAASLQKNSVNKKLAHLTDKILKSAGHTVDHADFSEFNLPLYNADIQNNEGFPAVVDQFIKRMHNNDGLIISSPEYNYSTPGTLKNLIDWVSRVKPMPWQQQKILLMSASPSLVGGNRGLWTTRIPLEGCGALIYPDMFSLASAHEAFDDEGHLKDKAAEKRLADNVKGFTNMVEKLK